MMDDTQLPVVYIVRHGETAWTVTGQHTGLTDLPLTAQGERNALALASRLAGIRFGRVFSSPLQRARKTCALAGFESVATIDDDLVEWNYGEYEGLRSVDIRAKRSDWELFRDGCPGGESPSDVCARSESVIARMRAVNDNVLIFSSGHFIRVLAARWIGIEPTINSMSFLLSTASVSVVGYERSLARPVIRLWNDTHHLRKL